jgi:hypothetical protein
MSILGFHFADDGSVYNEANRARWLHQIQRIRPRFVVVIVGSQRQQATEFAREIRRGSPQTRVIIRHYADGGDEGMWKRLEPEDYIRRIGGLYLEQLADLDGWYLMPDNEFSSGQRADYDAWTAWLIRAAMEAHKVGLRLALGCQPTHNPEPDKIKWLDTLFQLFKRYPEHIYYRNVYYDPENRDGLRYVRDIVARMKQLTGYVPTIVIGEFGRLRKITEAQHGYKTTGISRGDLAREAVALYRTYLQGLSPLGIYACWFAVGDWPIGKDTFNIDDDDAFFDVLYEVANEKLPDTAPLPGPRPPVAPEPPVIIKPSPDAEPPKEEDTVKIIRPDRLREAQERLKLRQAQAEALRSERLMIEAQLRWLDKRAQVLQSELILAEIEVERLNKAVA